MKVAAIRGTERAEAEYDHSTEEYTWSYNGNNSEVKNLLSACDSGKAFRDMVTDDPDPDNDGPELINESYEAVSWDKQIETIAMVLRTDGFEILYLG